MAFSKAPGGEAVSLLSQLVPMVLFSLFQVVFSTMFLVLIVVIGFQYSRLSKLKEHFFGYNDQSIWRVTVISTLFGLAGGFIGSFLMILFGITLNGIGIAYLWGIALFLMLINPRYLCFAYGGGLLSLVSLIFGWPEVNIPQLMGLVAILHMVEALLILGSGHLDPVPVYLQNRSGRVVGGFNLQKFWPIPIVALTTVSLAGPTTGGVAMPDWWPLIKPLAEVPPDLVFAIIPVVAVLGYGELAVTALPEQRTRVSAVNLGLYSLVLLGLAVAASRADSLRWLPALFAPLGHELIILRGQKSELEGQPRFVPPREGVMILDVLPGSVAAAAGLRRGQIITRVNGQPIYSRWDLLGMMEDNDRLELEVKPNSRWPSRRLMLIKPGTGQLGVILVPEGPEEGHLDFTMSSPLGRWWGMICRKFRG